MVKALVFVFAVALLMVWTFTASGYQRQLTDQREGYEVRIREFCIKVPEVYSQRRGMVMTSDLCDPYWR